MRALSRRALAFSRSENSYNRDDVSIDKYLRSQFDVSRNYREEDPLLQEEELF